MVKKALIIAAGNGSRLRRGEADTPKPLRKVGGLPLIQRIMLTAQKAGIKEFVIVVGYEKEQIKAAVRSFDIDAKVEFVENPDWQQPNGLSVLAAADHIDENFVLLMSDHIFEAKALEQLRQVSLEKQDVVLGVDYKLDSIFDMDDATKVKVASGEIQEIDKELKDFNAVDTGLFLASPALFNALRAVKSEGSCSLSDGIRFLASQHRASTFDIGDAWWQDVDTKGALRHGEKLLLNDCRKATDGPISRTINRRISLWITKYLVRTKLSAHHMTGVTSLVGIASGVFMAQGGYWDIVLGAFLFQWASILDGVDGEMSRMKFTASKVGQWLDTISDNMSYVSFIIGLVIGTAKLGPTTQFIGILTLAGLGLVMLVVFTYLVRFTDSGSLLAVQQDFKGSEQEAGLMKKFFSSIQFMIKRDFFAFFFLVLAVLGQQKLILWLCFLGTNITWMVLLNARFGIIKLSSVEKEISDPTLR